MVCMTVAFWLTSILRNCACCCADAIGIAVRTPRAATTKNGDRFEEIIACSFFGKSRCDYLPCFRDRPAICERSSAPLNEGCIELADGGAAEELQRSDDVGAEDVDRAGDAGAAGGAEAVCVGAADEDGAGAEGERLDDVAAAADAAIEEHLGPPFHSIDDFRQNAERRGDAVELAAAVVRDDDGIGAVVDRLKRVVGGVNAFRDDWP